MKNSKILIFMLSVLALVLCLTLVSRGTDAALAQVDTAPAVENAAHPVESKTSASGEFAFSTTALDGSTVDESIFVGKSLIMLNLWEPWCGPCVQEMPDLQKLYEEYKDKGFLLIGAYSTESGTANIVEKLGISYPIVKMCAEFSQFQTQYVPTTVFLDAEGKMVGEQFIGGASYEVWKSRIEKLMP